MQCLWVDMSLGMPSSGQEHVGGVEADAGDSTRSHVVRDHVLDHLKSCIQRGVSSAGQTVLYYLLVQAQLYAE